MTTDAQAVLREALDLSREDRAGIAAELLASLDEPEGADAVQSLWARELEQRARRALSGQSPGEDWARVRQRLADELAG
ncbi:MAG TPA: addiction module protein [Acidimicrobiales bacterium]|nr:addiction module protein [Acidimicrobiales bacterium]